MIVKGPDLIKTLETELKKWEQRKHKLTTEWESHPPLWSHPIETIQRQIDIESINITINTLRYTIAVAARERQGAR